MSRTCYLHIGIPKTGTSFIQSFLSANRERLRSEGQLLYPSSLLTSGIASHRRFSASIQAPRNTAADRQLFRINADNSDAFTKEVWLELDRELEHSSPSKVVISSEFCVNFDGSEIARLAEYLHARFEDVRVVVYLRRQDEHAVSGFDEASKWGSARERALFPDPPLKIHDYRALLERYAERFGFDAMIVRRFGNRYFKGAHLLNDFFDAIGVPLDESYTPPPRINVKFGQKKTEFLQRLDIWIRDWADIDARTWIARAMQEVRLVEASGIPKGAAEYCARFNKINEWVRSTFFPEEQQLFDAPDRSCEQTFPPLGMDEAFTVFGEVLRVTTNQIATLSDSLRLKEIRLARARNDMETALLIAQRQTAKRLSAAPILAEHADLLLSTGEPQRAADVIRQALELDPDSKRIRSLQTRILRELNA